MRFFNIILPDERLQAQELTFSGPDAAFFKVVDPAPFILNPGKS